MDMLTLKRPIKLTERERNSFIENKGVLLFLPNRSWFIIFDDFKIEEKIVREKRYGIFGGKTIDSKEYRLTEAYVLMWDRYSRKWYSMSESGINFVLDYHGDLSVLRTEYLDTIKTPLESLGVVFKINKSK